MNSENQSPPHAHAAGSEESFCLGAYDTRENAPKSTQTQAESRDFRATRITCASMRADDLRACLTREILRAATIGIQAQAALLDEDDEAALACLRRQWLATRAGIAPLAAELKDLQKTLQAQAEGWS